MKKISCRNFISKPRNSIQSAYLCTLLLCTTLLTLLVIYVPCCYILCNISRNEIPTVKMTGTSLEYLENETQQMNQKKKRIYDLIYRFLQKCSECG